MKARLQTGKVRGGSLVPEIGKIKIGERRKKGGKAYPASLDYFRATGKYSSHFNRCFEEPPSKITITFHSDDMHDICRERLELRDGSGSLYAYGDGETFDVFDGDDYRTLSIDEYPDLMDSAARRATSPKHRAVWKHVLDLRFMIPQISGVAGHWHLRTAGEASSIPRIVSTVDGVLESAGTLWRIPFDLSVSKVKSQKPGGGRVFPVLTLVPNVSAESMDILRELTPGAFQVRGLLDDATIHNLQPKQIGDGK